MEVSEKSLGIHWKCERERVNPIPLPIYDLLLFLFVVVVASFFFVGGSFVFCVHSICCVIVRQILLCKHRCHLIKHSHRTRTNEWIDFGMAKHVQMYAVPFTSLLLKYRLISSIAFFRLSLLPLAICIVPSLSHRSHGLYFCFQVQSLE